MVGISQSITGSIIDKDTQAPLSKASVQLSRHSAATLSNESGRFTLDISGVMPSDTLLVTYVGYAKYLLPLSTIKQQSDLSIRMVKEVTLLNEVQVISEFWLKQYPPEKLLEDYRKFYKTLEKVHTGLFEYIPEQQWSALKDSSLQLCKHPMTHSEFYQLIALHVGKIRNTHTRHGVTDSWYKRKTNIFPFNVRYFDERLYVYESFVADFSFPKGTEILEINGRTPGEIKSMVWPYIPADGYIETGKMAALDDYFPWYFALFVEETEQYNIKVKTLSGEEIVVNSPGFRSTFASLSWNQLQRRKKSALELKIDTDFKTAYFRIEDSHFFKDSLHTYFQRIHDNNVQSLIIDLRGEGGIREEEQVAELYSYLVKKPFQVYERIEVKSNDFTVFDKDFTFRPYAKSAKEIKEQYLDKLEDSGNGYFLWQEESYLGILQPAAIRFAGTLYILVDGRTYSASTDVVSLASKLDNVFIVGEETGGEHRSYISGAMFGLVLPNSKIGVKIPSWKTVLAIEDDPSQKGRGVMPDFPVAQSFVDFMDGRDTVREFANQLVRSKQ
jgi:hypothetical protein